MDIITWKVLGYAAACIGIISWLACLAPRTPPARAVCQSWPTASIFILLAGLLAAGCLIDVRPMIWWGPGDLESTPMPVVVWVIANILVPFVCVLVPLFFGQMLWFWASEICAKLRGHGKRDGQRARGAPRW